MVPQDLNYCGTTILVGNMKRKAKLQKHFAYRYKDKPHYKHVVTISEELIRELGWPTGVEVEQRIDGDNLVMALINPEISEGKEKPSKDLIVHELPELHSPKEPREKPRKRGHKNAKGRMQ